MSINHVIARIARIASTIPKKIEDKKDGYKENFPEYLQNLHVTSKRQSMHSENTSGSTSETSKGEE